MPDAIKIDGGISSWTAICSSLAMSFASSSARARRTPCWVIAVLESQNYQNDNRINLLLIVGTNGFISLLFFSHFSTASVHSNTEAAGSESEKSSRSATCSARRGTADFNFLSKATPYKFNWLITTRILLLGDDVPNPITFL